MKNEGHRNDWHSAFAGGLSLSLRAYRKKIHIDREFSLTKEPPRIDFLVVKKDAKVNIKNAIGKAFRKYNIIEYKNPNDALNIDVVYKVIGYAGLYKGLAKSVNEIPSEELTITIFRSSKPVKLFHQWQKEGKSIANPYPGVYRVDGIIEIPLQVVVTKELDDPELVPLQILMKDADEGAVRAFLQQKYSEKSDKQDADAVLQVSVSVNNELYKHLRGDNTMCEALRELMSDDIQKAEQNARNVGGQERQDQMIRNMLAKNMSEKTIAEIAEVPVSYVKSFGKKVSAGA